MNFRKIIASITIPGAFIAIPVTTFFYLYERMGPAIAAVATTAILVLRYTYWSARSGGCQIKKASPSREGNAGSDAIAQSEA